MDLIARQLLDFVLENHNIDFSPPAQKAPLIAVPPCSLKAWAEMTSEWRANNLVSRRATMLWIDELRGSEMERIPRIDLEPRKH